MLKVKYSLLDHLLIVIDNGVRSIFSAPVARRDSPAQYEPDALLSASEKKHAAALMRVNHTGEVCAQALYYGQALVAKSSQTKLTLLKAASEETDHLAWCQNRIKELNDHTSYLNPLWYVGALSIGIMAGLIDDKLSLGFVVETEQQVETHLKTHLLSLPVQDIKSRKILQKMSEEEAHHATVAWGAGARELPTVIKKMMRMMSKVMTSTTYYF